MSLLQTPAPGDGQHRNHPEQLPPSSWPCCSPRHQAQRCCLCRDSPESFDSFSEPASTSRGAALPPAAARAEGIVSSKVHFVEDSVAQPVAFSVVMHFNDSFPLKKLFLLDFSLPDTFLLLCLKMQRWEPAPGAVGEAELSELCRDDAHG